LFEKKEIVEGFDTR